jgi:hypothetical protein
MPVYFPPLGSLTDAEFAQDAVGAMVDATLVYNDATPSLGRAAITGDVTIAAGSNAAVLVAHATRHQSGGSDPIKLDDLAAPDDNTDLNASTSAHGLLKKLPGGTQQFLRADGTFAVPGSTAGSIDPFEYTDRSWEHQVDLDGLAYSSKGVDFTFTLTGASAIVMDSDARWIRNTPNLANIGEATLVQAITGIPHRRRWQAIHVFRGKTYNDISSTRIWVGFSDTAPQTADDPASAHLAGFRYSTAAGDTNWMACVKDGATISATSSGVAVAIDTMYLFRIEMDSAEVRFYIDGTLVHTATSNLPGIDTSVGVNVSLTQLAASARSILYSRQFVRQRG